jgi:hypothetical protein
MNGQFTRWREIRCKTYDCMLDTPPIRPARVDITLAWKNLPFNRACAALGILSPAKTREMLNGGPICAEPESLEMTIEFLD